MGSKAQRILKSSGLQHHWVSCANQNVVAAIVPKRVYARIFSIHMSCMALLDSMRQFMSFMHSNLQRARFEAWQDECTMRPGSQTAEVQGLYHDASKTHNTSFEEKSRNRCKLFLHGPAQVRVTDQPYVRFLMCALLESFLEVILCNFNFQHAPLLAPPAAPALPAPAAPPFPYAALQRRLAAA